MAPLVAPRDRMLRLLALTCLLAAAAAQSHFYCNTSPTSTIREQEFFLTTRSSSGDVGYRAGQTCEFNAETTSTAFLVEIQAFQVSTATVTISSGTNTLFRGSAIQKYQSSIVTTSKSLRVRFDASGDHTSSPGVTLRVRAFDVNGCPPGWVYISGNCFGTSNITGRLNYANAQRACNNMRSNLLHVPSSYGGSISSFVRLLPGHLKSWYTWIGLTDKTANGQYKYYWLNGDREYSTGAISCVSGGSYYSCYSYERCGTIYDRSSVYTVYMDSCSAYDNYACSMPPGGASLYYGVPDGNSVSIYVGVSAWVWGVVVGCVFVVGLIVVGVYSAIRSSNNRRFPGATNVVVSTGRVTIPPPSTGYPQQQYPQQPYPQQPYPQYPIGQVIVSPAPPTYERVADGGGYGNPGFQANK